MFNIFNNLGINSQDDRGRTKLYIATKEGNCTQVKKLLASGAKPNIKNNRGLTALHQAAYWGELEILKSLLKAGADPSADNGNGWTPLHSSALSAGLPRRKQIIKLLVEAGADADKEDLYGWSPKDYMELWVKHDKGNLKKLQLAMNNKKFMDDIQQPNINELGLKKNNPEPPAHHRDNDEIENDVELSDDASYKKDKKRDGSQDNNQGSNTHFFPKIKP